MAILEGSVKWASITTPNTKFEPVYTVDLIVDETTANDFAARGHKVKQHDEGPALVIKRKVHGPNGITRPAPRLLDKDKQEINLAVGNGSKVRVQYNEFAWEYAGKSGVSLDFQAMQVLDLVPMKSQDGDELNPFGDGEEF